MKGSMMDDNVERDLWAEDMGLDAAKWAKEFRATAIRLGYSDMDEGWLIGWFANAIEYARRDKLPPPFDEFRATFCLASPGSDTEFSSFLQGFDAAVNIARVANAPENETTCEARVWERAAERLDLAEHDAEERDWRSGANAFAALAKDFRAEAALTKISRLGREWDATQ